MTTSSIESTSGSTLASTMIRIMFRLGSVGTGLIAIVAGLLYAKQESLLYFPELGGVPRRPASNPRGYRSPSEYNIPFETHMIKCEDGVSIHAWLLLHPQSKAQRLPTIIFFHGNAGNIGLRLPNAKHMFSKLNSNILMVEYRGYGNSDTVKPTEKGLKLDAQAALHFIHRHEQIDPHRIFCFGRSLGGAVAFHLAHYTTTPAYKHANAPNPPLAGILLENTFLSISKMVDQLMPLVAPLKFLVLRMDWNNELIASTPTVNTPVLYLAGDKDELVPHNHMMELYKKSAKISSSHAKMHVISGGTHNDSWVVGGREYFEKTRAFMSHVLMNIDNGNDNDDTTTCSSAVSGYDRVKSVGSVSSIDPTEGVTIGNGGNNAGVEIHMGEEGSAGASTAASRNAIPIMPGNLVGMAREATTISSKSSSSDNGTKKEK